MQMPYDQKKKKKLGVDERRKESQCGRNRVGGGGDTRKSR